MQSQEMEQPSNNAEPPGSHRQPPWDSVPDLDWFNWKWQLSHSITSMNGLVKILRLSDQELKALDAPRLFRFGVTPYFANLIDPRDVNCPIRRQVIPTISETEISADEITDSLGEEEHSPVPGLIHRYPDRVLMLVNTQCASYCRFCTRSRLVGDPHHQYDTKTYQSQIEYIAATPAVRDVLLSGGDPLILPQAILESILIRLREIPHVEVVRIGTRVPIFLPMRIDDDLCNMLRKYHPLWVNVHVNHPREITPEAETAFARLVDVGIPLGSQTVLLAGVNDCPKTMKKLVQNLVQNRVRPYYLYQCDQVPGSSHFRTSIGAGLELIENLRGHTSGFAVPTYVIDAPSGGGKVPILPQYLISFSDSTAVVRNYEGLITAYHQPLSYQPHNSLSCSQCQGSVQSGQAGISAILAGETNSITPLNWQNSHQRSVPLPECFQSAFSMDGKEKSNNRQAKPKKSWSMNHGQSQRL